MCIRGGGGGGGSEKIEEMGPGKIAMRVCNGDIMNTEVQCP